ncbi:MAG: hypothetical protein KatS3mg057_1359 [Herpetosiphonaceae bacterium]|nr:MAG: hypothetical protein KatS3mg057_1359 [Herpetosiphonaceae bacterium]
MLTSLSSSAQRLWLLTLLLLWGLLLFGGFLFGRPNGERSRRMPAWTRLGSSLVLVVAAWSWYWLARDGMASSFALLIAAGMSLGFVGDLFMAQLIPVTQPVLGGISAFGLGHIAYIAAILVFAGELEGTSSSVWLAAWAAWLLVGAAGWYVVVLRGRRPSLLHWAALPYSLLLASTAGAATGLALQSPAFVTLAVGAGLFLLSDLILATRLFNNVRFPLIDDIVWLTYGPGQMLIVFAVNAALGVQSS